MEIERNWTRFIKSGRVNDYLAFVNSCKEKEIIEGSCNPVHDRCTGNKGNECRGE